MRVSEEMKRRWPVEISGEVKWRRMMTPAVAVLTAMLFLATQAQAQWPIDPCKSVNCQKGQCVANATAFLGFECQCDKGWTKLDPAINFLGCFLPNCSLNLSCDGSPAPPPPPPPPPPAIGSIPSLDPRSLCLLPGLCGNGDCQIIPTTGFLQLPTYSCHCHSGSANMFNQSMGPCLPECNVNGTCRDLGLPIITAPPPPGGGSPVVLAPPPPNGNEGEMMKPSRLSWVISVALFMSAICSWL